MHFDEKLNESTQKAQSIKQDTKTSQSTGESLAFGNTNPLGKMPMNKQMLLGLQRTLGNSQAAMLAEDSDKHDHAEHESKQGSSINQVLSTPGVPLESGTKQTMERELGGNFSDVRMHVDKKAAESVQAAAFTVGNDIVVHPNHFTPGSMQAQRTLAHELTHVKQQAAGPVSGNPHPAGVSVSDPSDRFETEAERKADEVMGNIAHHNAG
ncbi:MAG: DUF4157 domain-containing protein [Firmicutes bacterium]|nr:DUF4157 domain-containing protein [Bacillota bacterium]